MNDRCPLLRIALRFLRAFCLSLMGIAAWPAPVPAPLLRAGHPVDWWFVFKLNAKAFPGCGGAPRTCTFGGKVQVYPQFGQQFVFASSENPVLQPGNGCTGERADEPLGATFSQVYNGTYYYLIWNDQFYGDPKIKGCSPNCDAPWGHSKGLLAWNDDGAGLVMQVSTPSWPAAGSPRHPRKTDGNTLGCIHDNDVEVSQHFFALKLTKSDIMKVLRALQNANVATDPKNAQIVKNGGPAEVRVLVQALGSKSKSATPLHDELSTGVELISKPSALHVPPWQLVSALLEGVPLRVASWWERPEIPSTTETTAIACWNPSLRSPGPVEIAVSGQWAGAKFGLSGGSGPDFNHAKIGVSTSALIPYTIFGDLNQQGALSGKNCASSQNGRGGLFYAINNRLLHENISNLLRGDTAPPGGPSQ
jgi:hypothetical protein